jgi:hypothetical protein
VTLLCRTHMPLALRSSSSKDQPNKKRQLC